MASQSNSATNDTFGIDPEIWETLDEDIRESIQDVSTRTSQLMVGNSDEKSSTTNEGEEKIVSNPTKTAANNYLPQLQELSLIKSLCYAYRCFYTLYQQFPHNPVVRELFETLTQHVKPFFQHVYQYRKFATETTTDIGQNMEQLLQERVSHSGDYEWIASLEINTVKTIEPSEDDKQRETRTVLSRTDSDKWSTYCSRLFSRFVNSDYQNNIIKMNFTQAMIYSSKFNFFSSSQDSSQRLELHRMIPLLRERRPEQYEELYMLYYNMLSGFTFNRLVLTGKQEPAFHHILTKLFSEMADFATSIDDVVNDDVIQKMIRYIQSDEELKKSISNIDQAHVNDFQSQVSFMFTHFSGTGVMKEIMKNKTVQNLSQQAFGQGSST